MIDANTGIYYVGEKIKCYGFRPDQESRKLMQLLFDKVWSRSPSFSNLSINFFKDGDHYHGEILISSGEKLYIAKDAHFDLSLMMEKLERKIVRQLQKWHQSRPMMMNSTSFKTLRAQA